MNQALQNGTMLKDGEAGRNGVLARVAALVGDDLRETELVFQEELQSSRACVREVLQHVTRFQGKRLRPILLLLSARAAGSVHREHHVLAAVVEMIHMATLVHDDVLDEADTRRHVATVNRRWNNETSVLFGDYLFTHAFHLASSLETTLACRVIGRATNIVCEGELTQVHERGNADLTEEQYLDIVSAKTAELCAVSCFLGAHYAGAGETVSRSLEQYGRALGIAFQISDDLLDLLGDEAETGKTLGSDLEKQKLTLPLIRLMQQADETDAQRIRELLSHPAAASRRELREFLEQSDALDYARSQAEAYVAEAQQCLEVLPPSASRSLLQEIAEFSIRRSF